MTAILDETMPVVSLAQALAAPESSDKIRLAIVTKGIQSAPDNAVRYSTSQTCQVRLTGSSLLQLLDNLFPQSRT